MNASNESTPLTERLAGAPTAFGQVPVGQTTTAATIDPDNPPWGIVAGTLTWVASVGLVILMGILFVIPYIPNEIRSDPDKIAQFLSTDKTAIFLEILSAIPSHLLTLGIVWAVVTGFGKRPFWKLIGWSWSERCGPWKTVGLAVVLFLVGVGITKLIKGGETDIDLVANSSLASRYMLVIAAGITAPLVEEMVYRGVLYSSLKKTIGVAWAVAIVSFIFALVHVWQYRNNVGVIIGVSILSLSLTLLRAYTGRLLPCFIIHLIFNGIPSILLILDAYWPQSTPDVEHQAPAIAMLWRTFRPLFF